MIQITRGQANTIYVTATELSSLTSPYFMIRFIKDSTLLDTSVVVTNTSSYTRRYDSFVVTESDTESRLTGTLKLNAGDWHYKIYEQSTASLTVGPNDNLLEDGVCKVTDTALGNTYVEHSQQTLYVE